MTYLDVRLSAEDSWVNKYTGVKLPHDSVVKDPDKLRELSGPVITYYLKGRVFTEWGYPSRRTHSNRMSGCPPKHCSDLSQ